MLVIADTTPLTYLIRIGAIEILRRLYGQVAIPPEVFEELRCLAAPDTVRVWAAAPPDWVIIDSVDPVLRDDARWSMLDIGERAAIALAFSHQPAVLLLDERRGTRLARTLGLDTLGTLGILDEAARRHLISLPEIVDRLKSTSFRYPKSVLDRLLAEDARRKS